MPTQSLPRRALALALAALTLAASAPASAAYILRVPGTKPGPALTYTLAAVDQSGAPLDNGYAFGNVLVGEQRSGTIKVSNAGTGSVTLSSAAFSGAAAVTAGAGPSKCVAGMVLAPATYCYAYPVFTPPAASGYTAQLNVAGSDGAASSTAVTGTGVSPLSAALNAYDLNGNPLTGAVNYGSVQVGQDFGGTGWAAVILNTGAGTGLLSTLNLTGNTAFSLNSTTGAANCAMTASLAPNEFCNVYVNFAPGSAGTKSAAYTLGTSTGIMATVAVTGYGTTSSTGSTLITPTLGAFGMLAQVYGAAPVTLNPPTSNSNGAWSYSSSNPAVASIAGDQLTVVNVGTATIVATQAASGSYASASRSATLTVAAAVPTLGTFTVPDKLATALPFGLAPPTSTGSGSWSYTSSNTAVATVSGNTVTLTGPGTTTINATQAASGNYASASRSANLTVTAAAPTLGAFAIPTKGTGDAPFTLNPPTSNSSGGWTYSSGNLSVVTISGSTATIVGSGTVTITATQAASGPYASASTSTGLAVGATLNLTGTTYNYNVATALGNPAAAVSVTVTIATGAVVGSTNTATPAFSTGVLPAGSVITLINNGRIEGKGGDGGASQFGGWTPANYPGLEGGTAVKAQASLAITNNGSIFGGGGGGGGGSAASGQRSGGGGGGAGSTGGTGGAGGTASGYPTVSSGGPGTLDAGGAGAIGHSSSGDGGAGGAPGANGVGGKYNKTSGAFSNYGLAGYAIDGVSSVTWTSGNTATQVKGRTR